VTSASEAARVDAARAGDEGEFRALTDPYRRELIVHCYRFLASVDDAEDVVQEVMIRAWRNLASFEGRSSFRTWLYKVATNACLDALERRSTRLLPLDTHPPAAARDPLLPPATEVAWIGPIPDALLDFGAVGAEAVYSMREGVSLAFLAALQRLPPRQRAVLILRDVLGWAASEVAAMLELTLSSVNSLLARARASLKSRYARQPGRPSNDERALVDRYVSAWESGDVDALVALMKEDATMVMPPVPSWYRGRPSIREFIRASIFAQPGSGVRLRPAGANGQPAFAFYRRRGATGPFALFGVQLVSVERGQVAGLTTYVGPADLAQFGLAPSLD